jgi:hypothetical protein
MNDENAKLTNPRWVSSGGAEPNQGARVKTAGRTRDARSRQSADGGPALLARQRQLLLLLDALGGTADNLDFQKLLFLYCQEPASGTPYEFVPYRFGAFSFTSYADRRKLVDRHLLVDDNQRWKLTDEGRCAVGGTPDMHMAAFARQHRSLRGDALVAEMYRRFPYYAIRSEVAERVLHGDGDVLARIDAERCPDKTPGVLTVGYEGHTLEGYLNLLLRSGVTLLCDVRRNPISRKYGFAKATLSRSCDGADIRYEHLPELGIASEQRQGLTSQAHYDALFADYERTALPKQTKALDMIAEWIRAGERVALTCYEHLPRQCHRRSVAAALEQRLGRESAVNHI